MTTINVTASTIDTTQWTEAGYTWGDVGYDTETWSTAEETAFTLEVGEDISLLDKVFKDIDISKSESLSLLENLAKDITFDKFESFNFATTYADVINFVLGFAEDITFTDKITKDFDKNTLYETINLLEQISNNVAISKQESFSFVESYQDNIAFSRNIPESFTLSDSKPQHDITISKEETLEVIDQLLRRANARLSDLLIESDDFDLSTFKNMIRDSSPAGFEEFSGYTPGDYTYKSAVYRVKMVSQNEVDKARLNLLKLDIDVPDVVDTGTAQITDADAGVDITYNKIYHIIPDIVVSFKGGGTVSSAEYSNESTTGFNAKLRDSGGNLVTGTVSWAARGY